MPKRLKRKPHFTDATLTLKARVLIGFFDEDKPDFTSFDADFDDPYYDNFLLLIKDVEELPDDETLVDQQTQLTEKFKENMARCRDKFNDARYFIEKAFPGNGAVWDEFGYSQYDSTRRSFIKMDSLMTLFHAVANKYSVELAAKNYTQAMIDEIETINQALNDAYFEQAAFKKSRPVLTAQRIAKINELYDKIMEINRASKRIFNNDYARWQRYLLRKSIREAVPA